MRRITVGGAVLRGAVSTALTISLMSVSALAAPPVDLSKWSPEYVRSIAGTQDFDTAGDCANSSGEGVPVELGNGSGGTGNSFSP